MSTPPNAAPHASHAPFSLALRVYWEDTDAGGVVFYANYLRFFERARTEWLRHLGTGQQALRESTGALFVVSETRVRYLAPARLDDELQVDVRLLRAGSASMTVAQQARRGDLLLADGEIRIACVDEGTFRPRRIPNQVLATLPSIAPVARRLPDTAPPTPTGTP
ncbi:4-hydroxybenzoyl-CoA thioesterase family active site [Rubrivivax sp. A210]|uniref:tol-pal system-associated acyl-CoA thioesterase n=1 Tax=Rubrivivax sp. A210 TaxID=2772301 RepID=UPI0019198C76|nr:tol-pal system-associated acyl-CoA thioesterase [Rubrivivax sp. A210]CAD5372095.1 4-hydroxybenzoyl-CoA thioesterase family active site [Rubrivivax sp. A210]